MGIPRRVSMTYPHVGGGPRAGVHGVALLDKAGPGGQHGVVLLACDAEEDGAGGAPRLLLANLGGEQTLIARFREQLGHVPRGRGKAGP